MKNLKKLGEMQEIGSQLKKQREASGLALADIEKSTKIGIRLLENIEAGDFGALPSGVFARNFVRQYCIAIGVSPEPVLDKVFAVEPENVESENHQEEYSRRGPFILVVAVILVACIFWGYQQGVWQDFFSKKAETETHQSVIVSPTPLTEASSELAGNGKNTINRKKGSADENPVGKEAATQSSEASSGAIPKTDSVQHDPDVSASVDRPAPDSLPSINEKSNGFQVRFEADEKCWIHLRCPDKEMDFILMKGELYTTVCSDPASISVGNAEHIRVFVDNQKVVFPAGQRVVKDFVLTKSGQNSD